MPFSHFGQLSPGLPMGQPAFNSVPKPRKESAKELELREKLTETAKESAEQAG